MSDAMALAQQLVNGAQRAEAFGSGGAANVVRFFMREKGKGGGSTFVQSQGAGGKNIDYAFYARMNLVTAAGFQETRDIYQRVASQICTDEWWRKKSPKARLHVPRILLNVDRSDMAPFKFLENWITTLHQTKGKEMYDPTEYDGFHEHLCPNRVFHSISVVEGTSVSSILDVVQGGQVPDMTAHVMELALVHALDVAVGMGDRLQSGNVANITVNPATLQMVLIDVDTFLPPKNLGQVVEAMCVGKSEEFADPRLGRVNLARMPQKQAFVACPERLPIPGDYKKDVKKALQRDYEFFCAGLEPAVGVARNQGVDTSGKKLGNMGVVALGQYYSKLLQGKQLFVATAHEALKAIKKGVTGTKTFAMKVEDPTCSAARLVERVKQW
jgi:hypothetical protein